MTSVENTTSSTKNIKDNRKVVVAKFYAPRIVFKIPDGIDLEDKTVVKKWWVRNGTLYINFVDGHNEEIDEEYSTGFEELDCVQETVIEDAEDWNVEYSQDEEEEEEDECLAHPPYYCDGGCGKIVGDGYDDECKRICSLCEVTTDDVYYNYYICNHCFKIHSDRDEIDCKYCGRKWCVMLYQATNQKNAIKEARQ